MNGAVNFFKRLGPGILFASMAIGTSHLVLSTRAGALYGWIMVVPILLANVLKYPFFEFGIRYTNATDKSLIEGYLLRGKGYLWLYALITLISTFTIMAALYVVTAGLLINLLGLEDVGVATVALGLFVLITLLLIIGKYKFLEISLKYVVTVLFIAVVVTTLLVVGKGKIAMTPGFTPPPIFNDVGILFLIGLMGWMPTTVEASGWVSLWTMEKFRLTKTKPSLSEALREFNLGYAITAVLAFLFMIIGWYTMYGSGTELSGSSVVFAKQLVGIFTEHIGQWAFIFIAISAFATMFSTCMTAHDAIARVSIDVVNYLTPEQKRFTERKYYGLAVIFLTVVNYIVLTVFGANMLKLVGMATFVSFVLAPIIGYMNLKNVMGPEVPQAAKPGKGLLVLTYMGIIFLALFSLYYCWLEVF